MWKVPHLCVARCRLPVHASALPMAPWIAAHERMLSSSSSPSSSAAGGGKKGSSVSPLGTTPQGRGNVVRGRGREGRPNRGGSSGDGFGGGEADSGSRGRRWADAGSRSSTVLSPQESDARKQLEVPIAAALAAARARGRSDTGGGAGDDVAEAVGVSLAEANSEVERLRRMHESSSGNGSVDSDGSTGSSPERVGEGGIVDGDGDGDGIDQLSPEERELVRFMLLREGSAGSWDSESEKYFQLVQSMMEDARNANHPWRRLRSAYWRARSKPTEGELLTANVPGSGASGAPGLSDAERSLDTQAMIRLAMERFWGQEHGRSFLANDLVAGAESHLASPPTDPADAAATEIGPPGPGLRDVEHRFRKSKAQCAFCLPPHRRPFLDPMNWGLLRQFMTGGGNIIPRRVSGNCAKHQRSLARTIRRAKHIGVVSYKKGGFRIINPFAPSLPANQYLEISAMMADSAASPLSTAEGYFRFRGFLINEIRLRRSEMIDKEIKEREAASVVFAAAQDMLK